MVLQILIMGFPEQSCCVGQSHWPANYTWLFLIVYCVSGSLFECQQILCQRFFVHPPCQLFVHWGKLSVNPNRRYKKLRIFENYRMRFCKILTLRGEFAMFDIHYVYCVHSTHSMLKFHWNSILLRVFCLFCSYLINTHGKSSSTCRYMGC